MPTWTSTRRWSTVTPRREFSIWRSRWMRTILQSPQCTVKWTRLRETLLWRNLGQEPQESWSLPIYLPEVLMYNKLVSSSTTSFLSRRKTISIESVEPVGSAERVLQLTLSHQMMLGSLERSRIITTLKSKKCPKTWRNSTLLDSEDFRSILRFDGPACMNVQARLVWP